MANTKITAANIDSTSTGITFADLTVNGDITGTLATAAQPNITSVGTLTSITSSGSNDINGTDDLRLRFLNGGSFKAGIQVPTTSGDMISGSAVDDLAIRSQANILFSTGGNVEKLRIDSSGRVAIGTSSILTDTRFALHEGNVDLEFSLDNAVANTARIFAFDRGTTTHKNLQLRANQTEFYSGSTPAMTLDSSGNVGIGTDSPVNNGSGSQGLTINGTGNYQNLNLQVGGTTQFTIYTNGVSGTFINQVTADPMMFYTSDTERMRIDSSGNAIFTKSGGAYLQLKDASAVRGAINVETSDGLIFTTGSSFTERMRIDASGNVGIGTDSPSALLDVTVGNAKTANAGVWANLGKTNESSNYQALQCQQVGGSSASERRYEFQTIEQGVANAGSIVFQPSGGNVGIGTTSPNANAKLHVQDSDGSYPDDTNNHLVVESASHSYIGLGGGTSSDVGIHMGDSGGIGRGKLAYLNASDAMVLYTSGTEKMRIDSSGSLSVYNLYASAASQNDVRYNPVSGLMFYNTSSRRYKENIQDIPDGILTKINQARPVTFDEIGTDVQSFGLIAEELDELIPELVTRKEVDGAMVPDGITYSMLSVYLLKAIQEQQTIIDDLKTRIEALEG